jgi:plasmid rolling circle replication initiator protein Rep
MSKNNNNKTLYLTDYNANDKPWDEHRGQCDDVGGLYAAAAEFERYAERMSNCSGLLRFGWSNNLETGETRLRLREAHFCRVRNCPVCQWRRSLMWQARFFQSLPTIVESYPSARWVFLTLTVRNCAIAELGSTLSAMNSAFQRLKVRKEFKPVLGWIRTVEVTRGKDGSAHPHFHTLLMVPSSWFSRDYVKHSRWVSLWQECLRVAYEPNVDIRPVKTKTKVHGDEPCESIAAALQGAVAETLKYSVKPSDMTVDSSWFLELTRQTFKRRFVATGGVLKKILQLEEESDADLALADNAEVKENDDGSRVAFSWESTERHYRRASKQDKNPESN